MVWVATAGLTIIFCLPHLYRGVRTRRALHDVFGISEKVDGYIALYDSETDEIRNQSHEPMRKIERRDWRKDWTRQILNRVGGLVLWTVPGLELNFGQRM